MSFYLPDSSENVPFGSSVPFSGGPLGQGDMIELNGSCVDGEPPTWSSLPPGTSLFSMTDDGSVWQLKLLVGAGGASSPLLFEDLANFPASVRLTVWLSSDTALRIAYAVGSEFQGPPKNAYDICSPAWSAATNNQGYISLGGARRAWVISTMNTSAPTVLPQCGTYGGSVTPDGVVVSQTPINGPISAGENLTYDCGWFTTDFIYRFSNETTKPGSATVGSVAVYVFPEDLPPIPDDEPTGDPPGGGEDPTDPPTRRLGIPGVVIDHNEVAECGQFGVYVESQLAATVEGCKINACALGIVLSASLRCSVVDNIIESTSLAALSLGRSSDNTIVGNTCGNPGLMGASPYFAVLGQSHRNLLTGNRTLRSDVTAQAVAFVGDGCEENAIAYNDWRFVTVAGDEIIDDGTSTLIFGNLPDFQDTTDWISDKILAAFSHGQHIGISATVNDVYDTVVLTNTDRGSVAVAAHVAAADPHPQYLVAAEIGDLVDDTLVSVLHEHAYMEDHSQACDGAVTRFVLANEPAAGTVQVFWNGLLQRSDDDYTMVEADEVELADAPGAGDLLLIAYEVA